MRWLPGLPVIILYGSPFGSIFNKYDVFRDPCATDLFKKVCYYLGFQVKMSDSLNVNLENISLVPMCEVF